jgi:hypothetical protein
MSKPTDELLIERGSQHGDFSTHAAITQQTKDLWRETDNWQRLSHMQREALEMIAHKVGRILAGNPDHPDHWDDTAGYARLVSQRLPQQEAPRVPRYGNAQQGD